MYLYIALEGGIYSSFIPCTLLLNILSIINYATTFSLSDITYGRFKYIPYLMVTYSLIIASLCLAIVLAVENISRLIPVSKSVAAILLIILIKFITSLKKFYVIRAFQIAFITISIILIYGSINIAYINLEFMVPILIALLIGFFYLHILNNILNGKRYSQIIIVNYLSQIMIYCAGFMKLNGLNGLFLESLLLVYLVFLYEIAFYMLMYAFTYLELCLIDKSIAKVCTQIPKCPYCPLHILWTVLVIIVLQYCINIYPTGIVKISAASTCILAFMAVISIYMVSRGRKH